MPIITLQRLNVPDLTKGTRGAYPRPSLSTEGTLRFPVTDFKAIVTRDSL